MQSAMMVASAVNISSCLNMDAKGIGTGAGSRWESCGTHQHWQLGDLKLHMYSTTSQPEHKHFVVALPKVPDFPADMC